MPYYSHTNRQQQIGQGEKPPIVENSVWILRLFSVSPTSHPIGDLTDPDVGLGDFALIIERFRDISLLTFESTDFSKLDAGHRRKIRTRHRNKLMRPWHPPSCWEGAIPGIAQFGRPTLVKNVVGTRCHLGTLPEERNS